MLMCGEVGRIDWFIGLFVHWYYMRFDSTLDIFWCVNLSATHISAALLTFSFQLKSPRGRVRCTNYVNAIVHRSKFPRVNGIPVFMIENL